MSSCSVPFLLRPIPSYSLPSTRIPLLAEERIAKGSKGKDIVARLEKIAGHDQEVIEAALKLGMESNGSMINLEAVGILVGQWTRINSIEEPLKSMYNFQRREFYSDTIYDNIQYRITVPLSNISFVRLLPPADTVGFRGLIINLSRPPLFSIRPLNSPEGWKEFYDFTNSDPTTGSAKVHKILLNNNAGLEGFVNGITQALRIQENWFLPASPFQTIWSTRMENIEEELVLSNSNGSTSSYSTEDTFDFDQIDSEISSSQFTTPEIDEKWKEEDEFWMDDLVEEEEGKVLDGLGLFIDLPPFTPQSTALPPATTPTRKFSSLTLPKFINSRDLSKSFHLPNILSQPTTLLPPLPLNSPPPKPPYNYHRSKAAHLQLPPLTPRQFSSLPLSS